MVLAGGIVNASGPNEVEAAGEKFTAPTITIATGGYPTLPDIPGANLAITSDGFFELEELPKKVAVVGAGCVLCRKPAVARFSQNMTPASRIDAAI
jgi:glutathione reductase (NADPH)